jgi:hypothetical protein
MAHYPTVAERSFSNPTMDISDIVHQGTKATCELAALDTGNWQLGKRQAEQLLFQLMQPTIDGLQ